MRKTYCKKKRFLITWIVALATVLGTCFPSVNSYASSGNIFTCVINRGYKHPVTGMVEDSGGEGSYATGQGMVEGCVSSTGLFEVTDNGECYLNIRMGLADFTSRHSFSVQKRGETEWEAVTATQTGTGSDDNGATIDFCIPVPQEDCVIRASMYVDPMGRDVIFFVHPSDFTEGNSAGMTATMVTEPPASPAQETPKEPEETTVPESEEAMPNVETNTLNDAKGLSLSTEKEETETETVSDAQKGGNNTAVILIVAVAVVVVGACAVYFTKKYKNKGDTRDDDE